MSDNNNIIPYPLNMGVDQLSNKFSNYNGNPIPWPTQYVGAPTDSSGKPIAGYAPPPDQVVTTPGVSLGSTPLSYQQLYGQDPGVNPMNPSGNGQMLWDNWGAFTGLSGMTANDAALRGNGSGLTNVLMNPNALKNAAGTTTVIPGNNSAAYLGALANPGHVTTPGMPVQPVSNQPSNDVFNTILAQLRAQHGSSAPPGIGGGSSGVSAGTNSGLLSALSTSGIPGLSIFGGGK